MEVDSSISGAREEQRMSEQEVLYQEAVVNLLLVLCHTKRGGGVHVQYSKILNGLWWPNRGSLCRKHVKLLYCNFLIYRILHLAYLATLLYPSLPIPPLSVYSIHNRQTLKPVDPCLDLIGGSSWLT